jgi:hypothetical protein
MMRKGENEKTGSGREEARVLFLKEWRKRWWKRKLRR